MNLLEVVIRTEKIQNDVYIGRISLDRPQALNALNYEMYLSISRALEEWEGQDDIAAVLIDSTSPKAFSAGGDVKWVTSCLSEPDGLVSAKEFFALEYYVDYLVRTFAKPVICWADGITMGAGLGLMNGASHRIVSETTVLAMPEVKIGLFPDVGASYFLNRLPIGVGLFMGLTAAQLSGEDALTVSLADFFIPSDQRVMALAEILSGRWFQKGVDVSQALTGLLDEWSQPQVVHQAPIMDRMSEIAELMDQDSLKDIDSILRDWEPGDEYFKKCKYVYEEACPLSINVFYELLKKAPRDLIQLYAREWNVAAHFCEHSESFVEGVRAVLVDKDNDPNWKPSRLSRVQGVPEFFIDKDGHDRFVQNLKNHKYVKVF